MGFPCQLIFHIFLRLFPYKQLAWFWNSPENRQDVEGQNEKTKQPNLLLYCLGWPIQHFSKICLYVVVVRFHRFKRAKHKI